MRKRDIVIALSAFGVALVLAGGSALLWRVHQQNRKQLLSNSQEQGSSDSSTGASGLSVGGGTAAANLGQLDSSGQSQQGASSGGGSSGSSSSSSGATDTSKFVQYDKYKDSQHALFGDIKVGTGAELTNGKKGSVYYKLWLTNGALVDQSPVSASGQPQPFAFTLGSHQVIPGWEEAISGMKVGGIRLMIVPPAVGYGAQGQGTVPPNAVLVFQVQLLDVR